MLAFSLFLTALWTGPCWAQQASSGSDINIQLGNLLPDQVDGVAQIMPFGAAYYKYSFGGGGIELGAGNAHANGSDYFLASLRGFGEVPLDTDLSAIFYLGPNWNYYTKLGEQNRQNVFGIEVGGGAMFKLVDTLWLRGEMRFASGPGTSLYFGIGFSFRSGSSGGS